MAVVICFCLILIFNLEGAVDATLVAARKLGDHSNIPGTRDTSSRDISFLIAFHFFIFFGQIK